MFFHIIRFIIRFHVDIDIQPTCLDLSRSAVESDGDVVLIHDDRNLAYTVGILQHDLHLIRVRLDADVLHLPALLGKSFTSLIGIGSRVLSENQYFTRHGSFPPCPFMNTREQ